MRNEDRDLGSFPLALACSSQHGFCQHAGKLLQTLRYFCDGLLVITSISLNELLTLKTMLLSLIEITGGSLACMECTAPWMWTLALTICNVNPSGSIASLELAQTTLLEKFKMQ